ncbi:MAG: DUF362 domain-containing protein [Acidobacteria bacterium]|nr:DUF362 domain-containing protein [Acidobacteriota bacterium]
MRRLSTSTETNWSVPDSYTDLGCLWLPKIVLGSDFVVSLAKMKMHHWSGVTLA